MERFQLEPKHRFTVEDVSQMLRSGILTEDDRVELIEGQLLVMPPNHPPHAQPVSSLNRRCVETYKRHTVRVQLPLTLSKYNEPEPDIVVARGTERTYSRRHPGAADCVLVVEVAWSSKQRDLLKAEIYAREGVKVYWILDVKNRRLEVYEHPKADGTYKAVRVLKPRESVTLPETDVSLKIADLLPAIR